MKKYFIKNEKFLSEANSAFHNVFYDFLQYLGSHDLKFTDENCLLYTENILMKINI